MTKREQFIQWLGDAHAMEVGIATTLEKHIADASGQPKVRAELAKHLKETKRHAEEMKKALASLGGTHPVIKEGVSKLANLVAGLMTSAAADTMVKNAIADFATEHFEIACYKSLIVTANLLGEKKIAAVCKGILKEEEAMAKVLDARLASINETYLATLDTEQPASSRGAASRSRGSSGGKSTARKSTARKSAAGKSAARKSNGGNAARRKSTARSRR